VVETPLGRIGMTVCYDLRFPELYVALVERGAQLLTVPSAFTLTTGKDHWKPLLRARAIESQCWLLAPAQVGRHDDDGLRYSWGHSMIVDPWGEPVATASEGPGIALAEIELDRVGEVRRRIPVQEHRRPPSIYK
jgi:predicted amidohydrolase